MFGTALGTLGSVAFDTMAVLLTSGVVFPFFLFLFFIIIKILTGGGGYLVVTLFLAVFLFYPFSSGLFACIIIYYLFIVWVSEIGGRGFIRDLSGMRWEGPAGEIDYCRGVCSTQEYTCT